MLVTACWNLAEMMGGIHPLSFFILSYFFLVWSFLHCYCLYSAKRKGVKRKRIKSLQNGNSYKERLHRNLLQWKQMKEKSIIGISLVGAARIPMMCGKQFISLVVLSW